MATDLDRVRVLVPHWIEHNSEHAQEFRDWATRVRDLAAGLAVADEAADAMVQAAEAMEQSNLRLAEALRLVGK
jgi:hypothetical protein